jgi:hypothetical protein
MEHLLDLEAEEGVNYQLEASAPLLKSVRAETYFPAKTLTILSVDTSYINRFDERYFKLLIRVEDQGIQPHYYGLQIIQRYDDEFFGTLFFEPTDPVFDIRGRSTAMATFRNASFQNQTYQMEVLLDYYSIAFLEDENGELEIQVLAFAEPAYLYNRSLQQYQFASDDFFSEPVQVYNNVENGFGIFSASRLSDTFIQNSPFNYDHFLFED